ncbi:MAG: tyrosine-type recombinase/integrase, partial [Candidatus Krumholzibacteriota bacterium]|nr:tyrosine-type recombinase/integrase [Candidatus Krumholzibacteriota bacterium]
LDVRPHDLRHTFATRLLIEHRSDIATVKELLGHANVQTTMIYLHPTRESKRQAIESLSGSATKVRLEKKEGSGKTP